jgi:diguanylate cyclase (GGDEF)-like protein/PAS domain S-box-containing protein
MLLVVFSVVMSVIIVLAYHFQTEKFNRVSMTNALSHLTLRIENQENGWIDDSNHLFGIIEWSDLLNMKEPGRSDRLRAFFTSQGANIGFEGIVITDQESGKVLFDFWTAFEPPNFQKELQKNDDKLFYDSEHGTLYSVIRKHSRTAGHDLNVLFFKAWDNAMLHRITLPNTTTFVLLGTTPLLSSAGNLTLSTLRSSSGAYVSYMEHGSPYQERGITLGKVAVMEGHEIPLKLFIRAPAQNVFPISLVLGVSVSIALLFGALLFAVIGRWMGRLGTRLDQLADAALAYQNGQKKALQLLQVANADKGDQVSVVAQELASLMTIAGERDAEQRAYLQTLNLLQDAVIECFPDGRLVRATEAWKVMTGTDDLNACNITSWVHPEDNTDLLEQISALTHGQKEQVVTRFRMRRLNEPGAYYWVEGRFAITRRDDAVESIRGVIRDITSTYLQERQIHYMALHDALTDLPNRVLLEDRMEMAIARAARSSQRVALGFIDIDHFKQVNDNFGHKIGDRMLKEITLRLKTALRNTDTLSRWGGDEFVVLCPDLNSLHDAMEIAQKLLSVSQEYITIDDTDFPYTFSGGFALYPDDAGTSEVLLAQADRTMFYAKAQGRNSIQFFNAIAGKDSGRHSFYIQSRLMQAINNNHIQCWLQPIMSASTGEVLGAEALARWEEPEQGWIPPSVFVPMAESMGMIDKVGQQVWQQALRALSQFPAHHYLSVNLSKRQLFSSTIAQQFHSDVVQAHISPGRVMLEITESLALSEVEYARTRIIELDAMGFGISVDDFGVGYSSLSQLHEIPADELKLDMSFVKRIKDRGGLAMVKAIVSIAKSLDLSCVAEGVEDAGTAALLNTMGVEALQGYYFARPMPIEEYLTWLTARSNR